MKCEHCGKNEVTFVYRSSVNGHVEEAHLCSDCAEKLGYTQRAASQSRSVLQNFFGGGSLFSDPFFTAPMFSAPSLMGRFLEDPFDDFFTEMPALGAAAVQPQPRQEDEKKKEEEEPPSRFARLRERNALKMEMKKAIHQENFERAAEIRDQLRQMEQEDQASEKRQ